MGRLALNKVDIAILAGMVAALVALGIPVYQLLAM